MNRLGLLWLSWTQDNSPQREKTV